MASFLGLEKRSQTMRESLSRKECDIRHRAFTDELSDEVEDFGGVGPDDDVGKGNIKLLHADGLSAKKSYSDRDIQFPLQKR